MIYDVLVTARGPEGNRGFIALRTTKAGSDELLERIKNKVAGDALLTGIEREEDPAPAEPPKTDE